MKLSRAYEAPPRQRFQLRRVVLCLLVAAAIVLLLAPASASAAINKRINFQGRLADTAGVGVPDGTYNLEFKLHDAAVLNDGGAQGACSGSCLWIETLTGVSKVTVTRGLFSVQLGEVASLATFDFDQDPLYLSVRAGGTAATPAWDSEMAPRHRLGAAPQAIHADNASNLGGQAPSYYTNASNLTGTVADSRLSTNIALRNVNNNFSAGQTVTGTVTATDLTCVDCLNAGDVAAGAIGTSEIADGAITVADLAFDPATQAELDAHKTSLDHDGRYFTETELSAAGTLNTGTNPLEWTKLKNVPAGFADGVDDTSGTASDVACTGCVGSTDIADGSVAGGDLAAGLAVPVGTLLPYWGTVLPANFAWADGASMSCTTYVELCATRGASGSIALPDMRGRAPVGVDGAAARLAVSADTLGAVGGEERHTMTSAEMPVHSHGAGTLVTPRPMRSEIQYLTDTYNSYNPQGGWGAISGWANDPYSGIGGSTANTGSGTAHNVMQPYQVVNYMIRVS